MEYYPLRIEWKTARQFITTRSDSVISQNNGTQISDFARNKNITEFNISTNLKDSLELPLIYYKGYTATLNGKDIPVTESSHGLVQIPVDRSGRVEAWYKGTVIQKSGYLITIAGIAGLCVYIFLQYRNRKKRSETVRYYPR
jgi:uncharacterized membrane protein YfhO